jgi:UDP-N-acetylglucosamine-lysosomal-enzyme
MPHFIDKDIMTELVSTFPEDWDQTSSHRLRSDHDMQYAFAYYHFLAELSISFNASAAFDEFDVDGTGLLSVHELRTIVTRLYRLPTTTADWHEFEKILLNCSDGQEELLDQGVGIGPDGKVVWVTRELFVNCTDLIKKVNHTLGHKKQHKTRFISEHDALEYIAFEMIRNNLSVVQDQLNAIRRDPKRFTCLNDNIDHRTRQSRDIVSALHDFYEAFQPTRSQFELPIGMRNRFLHTQDLREWQGRQKAVIDWSRITLIVVVAGIALVLTARKVRSIRSSPRLRRRSAD